MQYGELIGYQGTIVDNKAVFVNNYGEIGYDVDWLLFNRQGDNYKLVAYDLDYLAAVLFRSMALTQAEAEKLKTNHKLHYYGIDCAYDITYYPARYLDIKKGAGWNRPYVGFYDMKQYNADIHYPLDISIDDCISMAKQAKDTGVAVSAANYKLGLNPDVLTSPIKSLEKSILQNFDAPIAGNDIPDNAVDMALQHISGGWVEAYKIGHFEQAYDLDITTAYGYELSKLLDTRRGKWVRSNRMPKEAVYGFTEGDVTIKADFSPIYYEVAYGDSRKLYTPQGSWHTYLTKEEIEFIYKYKIGTYAINDGWWWIPQGQQYELYKGIVNNLYSKRENANNLENLILKRCLAGLWGKLLEQHKDGFGQFFNPIYGTIVEVNTKLKVASFVLDNNLYPDHLLHIATDGILIDKNIVLPAIKRPGEWRLTHTGKALVICSGIAAIEGKQGTEDLAISYNKLNDLITGNPDADSYTLGKNTPLSLLKALQDNKLDKLGNIEQVNRSFNMGIENKRLYWELPNTGKQLLTGQYNSEPLHWFDVSALGKKGGDIE